MKRLCPLFLALTLPCAAVAESPIPTVMLQVLPGWETRDGTYMSGLRISLAEGWKTYWRAPGDAGIPPVFDWAGSQNISTVAIHWPTPEVFTSNGMQTIGYHDEVVLPIEVTPVANGNPMRIVGTVEMGICDDICMPVSLNFQFDLPKGLGPNAAIAGALIDQPLTPDRAGVGNVTCTAEPIRDGLRLTASIAVPPTGESEVVVVEAPGAWVSESDTRRSGDTLTTVVDVVPDKRGFLLDRSSVRLTVLGSDRAVDIHGCRG